MIFVRECTFRNALVCDNQDSFDAVVKTLELQKTQRNCGKNIYNFKKINRNKAKLYSEIGHPPNENNNENKNINLRQTSNKDHFEIEQNKLRTLTSNGGSLKKFSTFPMRERNTENEGSIKITSRFDANSDLFHHLGLKKRVMEHKQKKHRTNSYGGSEKKGNFLRNYTNPKKRTCKNLEDGFEKVVRFQNLLLSATVKSQKKKESWRGRMCITHGQERLSRQYEQIKINGAKAPELETTHYFKSRKVGDIKDRMKKIHKIITQMQDKPTDIQHERSKKSHLYFSSF